MNNYPFIPPIIVNQIYLPEPDSIEKYGPLLLSFLLLVVTGILVRITYLYMKKTADMAATMEKDFYLRSSPVIHIQPSSIKRIGDNFRVAFQIYNYGEARIKFISSDISLKNITEDTKCGSVHKGNQLIILPKMKREDVHEFPLKYVLRDKKRENPEDNLRFHLTGKICFESALDDPFETEIDQLYLPEQ